MNDLQSSSGGASCTPGAPPHTYDDVFTSLPQAVGQREQEEKEVVYGAPISSEKQVAGADWKETFKGYAYGLPLLKNNGEEASSRPEGLALDHKRRKCLVWAFAVIIVMALGIGLGVGLGVGLARSRMTLPSGDSRFVSTRGAFNGTGIRANFDEGSSVMTVFYQHYTGEIRLIKVKWPSLSLIQSPQELIATDAKNGTSIGSTSINPPGLEQQHIFYVGNDGLLKQRIIDNPTSVWVDGPLEAQKITAFDSDKIGLVSGYYGGPIMNYDPPQASPDTPGIRLWVATSETAFDQMAWRPGVPKWIFEQSWEGMNGHANPTTNGIQPGHTTYVWFVNQNNDVGFYWRDTTENVESTPNHPINVWQKVSTTNFPAVDPTMGLSWHDVLYAVPSKTGNPNGFNISFAAENSTITSNHLPPLNGDCIPNSNLNVFTNPVDPPNGVPDVLFLYCQTEGDDVTLYYASPSGDSWTKAVLPIPDD